MYILYAQLIYTIWSDNYYRDEGTNKGRNYKKLTSVKRQKARDEDI
jgi:hypothetical protein